MKIYFLAKGIFLTKKLRQPSCFNIHRTFELFVNVNALMYVLCHFQSLDIKYKRMLKMYTPNNC